jgi:hypothetical protein
MKAPSRHLGKAQLACVAIFILAVMVLGMDLADRTVEALTADIVKYAIAGLGGTAGVMGGISASQNPVRAWKNPQPAAAEEEETDRFGVRETQAASRAIDYDNREGD